MKILGDTQRVIALGAVLLTMIGVTGCGASSGPLTPVQTVEKFNAAFNAGEGVKACALLTPTMQNYVRGVGRPTPITGPAATCAGLVATARVHGPVPALTTKLNSIHGNTALVSTVLANPGDLSQVTTTYALTRSRSSSP